jgi:hypothetical protein
MAHSPGLPASKEQINKAGDVLRVTAEEHRKPGGEYQEALMLEGSR